MPLAMLTPTCRRRIAEDIEVFAAASDWDAAKTAAAIDEVLAWPDQYVPPKTPVGGGMIELKCGLSFPLLSTDLFIDNTRGMIAPAAQPARKVS